MRHVRLFTLLTAASLVAVACSSEPGSATTDLEPGTIDTVVGTGESGKGGVGGPATEAQLRQPVDLAFHPDGDLYIAERHSQRVLKLDASGSLTLAAGELTETGLGVIGYSGDGGLATEAHFRTVSGITIDSEGNLYISDSANHRIRKVDPEGIITTIVGNGEPGFSGDGGPATQAQVNRPDAQVVDDDGNLYFLDSSNFRVRKVDTEGIITTIFGTGEAGMSPDGTPAIEAEFGHPSGHLPLGLGLDADGRLHIADHGNSRIWMIDSEGRIQTAAGNGESEFSGDGGPANEAGINLPLDITFGEDGSMYIATRSFSPGGDRVRRVDSNGVITTVAGAGEQGFSGDGGPATEAALNIPSGVAVGPDGNLYIADGDNNVIRRVVMSG